MLIAGAAFTHEGQRDEEHVDEFHRGGIVNLSIHLHLSGGDMLVTEVLRRPVGGPTSVQSGQTYQNVEGTFEFLEAGSEVGSVGHDLHH